MYLHISETGVLWLSKEQGVWGGILGKRRPHLGKIRLSWAICTKNAQKCYNWGQKFNHADGDQKLSACLHFI